MDLSNLKWVSKRNLQTFWDGIKGSLFGDLAFHEDGTESAHAYSAGDLLGHESHLYRATSNIAAGDTLESGVNMERTLVDAEIKRSRQSVNTEFNPRLSNILGDLATVEAAMVATQNYNKGDYIAIGDYFYKATDAITSGDTLTVGTNIKRTNVGAEMRELNPKYIEKAYSALTVRSTGTDDFYSLIDRSKLSGKPVLVITVNGNQQTYVVTVRPTLMLATSVYVSTYVQMVQIVLTSAGSQWFVSTNGSSGTEISNTNFDYETKFTLFY